MNKLKYLLRCFLRMDFSGMFRVVREVAKENGKFSAVIFFDMVWCALRYGAGYLDYRTFNFVKMSGKRRRTFVTRGVNNELIRKLNRREAYFKFENKVEFNRIFKDYLGRDWVSLEEVSAEEFAGFLKGKQFVMVKPVGELCGHGVEKIDVSACVPEELYGRLRETGQTLVEEYVVQHPEIARLCPRSVNTVRIVTVANPDAVHVMFRALRMGSGENVVDNFHFGGMLAVLNGEGVITTDAINEKNEVFSAHPATGTVFKGFKIPFYAEAEELVRQAARTVPEIRYAGWDVAVTETGPLFIEANHNPAYDFFQTRTYMAENEFGLLPEFKRVVKQD